MSLRPHRRSISAWLVGVLLFALWTTASYACPRIGGADAGAPMAMPGCDGGMGMDPDEPLRCQAHCTESGKAVGSASIALDLPPLLPAFGAIVAVLDAGAPPAAVALAADERSPPGGLPIYLRLLTLRN